MKVTLPPRTQDPNGLRILTFRESVNRLSWEHVGRLAFVADGDIHVYPITHAVDRGCIVFRSAYGTKFDAALRTATCSFEVDSFDPVTRTGWSVLATGVADIVDDEAEAARYDGLGLATWLADDRPRYWVRMRIDEVSGRCLEPSSRIRIGQPTPTPVGALPPATSEKEV